MTAGGATDTDAIHDNVASEISAIANKATPVAGDFFVIEDSAAANVKKHVTLGDLITVFNGEWLRLDCTNDPLTATLQAQTILPDGDLTYDLGSATINWDRVHARTGVFRYEQDGTVTESTAEGSLLAAWVNSTGKTATVSSNGAIAVVAIDSAADVTVAGIGSAAFGQTSFGTDGLVDIRATADNCWQFGPGWNLEEGTLKVGAAPVSAGVDTASDDNNNPGIILASTGWLYTPDSGGVRFGDGNRLNAIGAANGWYNCQIQHEDSNGLVIEPAAGVDAGTDRSVIIGSGQTGGDGTIEFARGQVNAYAGGKNYLQMLSNTAGGNTDAELRFGSTLIATSTPPDIGIHYDIANDDRLQIDADGTTIIEIFQNGNLSLIGGDLVLQDANNIEVQATTGTQIATATTDKLGFYGATPIVQQTTTSQTAATFTANSSGIVDDTATWNGYTVGDVVAILQAFGFLQ
jgi:hypothetical protein